jgi:hypothetical protein
MKDDIITILMAVAISLNAFYLSKISQKVENLHNIITEYFEPIMPDYNTHEEAEDGRQK